MASKIANRNSKKSDINSIASDKSLLKHAVRALRFSYSPYSKFAVGAAILKSNGAIYLGANIENASYPLCLCAERTALAHAHISAPGGKIWSIAVVCSSEDHPIPGPAFPCGACRQVISEFEDKQGAPIRVIVGMKDGSQIKSFDSIKELLPHSFNGQFLK
ncbi:MAG: cytidine deaminase [Saprospiraceae bacterium]|jgi:cytidine deaminase|nr:cytidine deaminase [Saprospiraceae bacterium]MBK7436254.1 cytidine deaminase [Saprospiraceae bacterium]MBK8281316.1 cytidine deaminase [Saprospiraceae bacterium]MBK8514380.1 cytidine deaminase [Saprospiraceae bacterium]MBK9680079.1 cytidine deaminase [Saprospiraceae bacterium]